MLTLDWLPTRVSDTGGPSKGYLFLVAHTKGIWYWWPVNCHLLTGGPHEGNRWPRHFSPVYVGATLPLGLNVKDEGGSFTLRPAPCYMYVNFAFWLPML